jgi:hypothetical protein
MVTLLDTVLQTAPYYLMPEIRAAFAALPLRTRPEGISAFAGAGAGSGVL